MAKTGQVIIGWDDDDAVKAAFAARLAVPGGGDVAAAMAEFFALAVAATVRDHQRLVAAGTAGDAVDGALGVGAGVAAGNGQAVLPALETVAAKKAKAPKEKVGP